MPTFSFSEIDKNFKKFISEMLIHKQKHISAIKILPLIRRYMQA